MFNKFTILLFYYLCCLAAFTANATEAHLSKKEQNNIPKEADIKKVIYGEKKDDFINNKAITNLIDDKKILIPLKRITINMKNNGTPDVCLKQLRGNKKFGYKFMNYFKLKKAKNNLKNHIKELLIANNVKPGLIKYIINNLKYMQITKDINEKNNERRMIDFIKMHDVIKYIKYGKLYKKIYKSTLSEIEDLFKVDPAIVISIWGMETRFGSSIGNYNPFTALYSACMNANSMDRLQYFEKNIIYLAVLIDRGFLEKHVISSFDGKIGGCQFTPESFYNFAISLDKRKADIISDNRDVLTSIANYLHSYGWRHNEGILTEVTLPKNFDKCTLGLNTVKKVKEWKRLGIELHKNKIGAKYMKNDTNASIILTDQNDSSKKTPNKRAFLVYDNYKVIIKYNQQLAYGLVAGLIFEGINSNNDV